MPGVAWQSRMRSEAGAQEPSSARSVPGVAWQSRPTARRPAPGPYRVRGKPRSILLVPGSGQREVTILARV